MSWETIDKFGNKIFAFGSTPDEAVEDLLAKLGLSEVEELRGMKLYGLISREEMEKIADRELVLSPKYAVPGIFA